MNYEQIILKRLEAGTLLRRKWTEVKNGKELACLLAAIAPKCGELGDAGDCPAEVMPLWLAYLTPWIDDAGTEEKWAGFVRRFAATSPKWGKLTQRNEYAIRALIVREAVTHTSDPEVIAVCNRVVELCEGVAAGGEIDVEVFSSFGKATWWGVDQLPSVVTAARAAATRAARVKAEAVTLAAESAVRAATLAAKTRAEVVQEVAADRIIDGILRVLEGV